MAKEYFIKDFLKRIKRPIELNGDEEYKLVTIKMNHNGVVLRERKNGCDIKSNMYIVKEGDFILSGIDARNGAFGIIPPELDGAIVTNDFWYFDLDENIISKELFLEITSTSWFDEICKKGSDGTTQRIRLQKDKFFNQKIWLPEQGKQKIILEKIRNFKNKFELLSKQIENQQKLQLKLKQVILQEAVQGKLTADWREQHPDIEPSSELLKRIKVGKVQLIKEKKIKKEKPLPPISNDEIPFELPDKWVWCRLGEIIEANPKNKKDDNIDAGFIPMPLVYTEYGKHPSFEIRKWKEIKKGFTHFADNDIGIAKITPCFENSKAGIFKALPNGIGSGTTELHILRTSNHVISEFIYVFIKRAIFIKKGEMVMRGAVGQKRVPIEYIRESLFPIPPLDEQLKIVEKVEALLDKCNQFGSEIESQRIYSQDLQKALFNEVFELKENKVQEKASIAQTVPLKPTNIDYHKRSVLAAEIVWQLHKEPTLGHLKLQKLIYLCQKTTNMQLATNFLRQAMGPYDNQLMRSIDKQLKQHKWFEYHSTESLKYLPLEKAGEHHADYLKYFSSESTNIQYIIDTFKQAKSSVVEIVATLYACMENILNEKNIIYSEGLLLRRFYEWSEEKQKFSEEAVQSVLKRMKEIGIVPDGLKN